MIQNQILINYIKEVSEATGSSIVCLDKNNKVIVDAGNQEKNTEYTFNVIADENLMYILKVSGGENPELTGKMLEIHLKSLDNACSEKLDKKTYFQSLLHENLTEAELYGKARKLHINPEEARCVYVIEPIGKRNDNILQIIKELFSPQSGDMVIEADESRIAVIKTVSDEEEIRETAEMLVDMAGSEAMQTVRVAYGNVAEDIKKVAKSYKEAMISLEIGNIFYIEKSIIAYNSLGVGRLIYQLPISLCKLYVKEIFGDDIPEDIDDEMLNTINKFFDNNLNVSETSRQLSMHRNTLLYRIDKVQKATGLDIRIFDDALALKIALMVVNYMRYIEDKE